MRELGGNMDEITISDYKPLVEDIKDKINKRQFQLLKAMNAETINLYWEIIISK